MKKVLLVDDDEVIHELIQSTLQKYNTIFELVHAFDVKEALSCLERGDISLIITDIVMPGADGFQLLSQIQDRYSGIPCIVITSYELPQLQERLEGKVFQFFKKPVMSQELADAILKGLKSPNRKSELGEFSVVGIVQLMENEGTTCRLDVHNCGRHQDIHCCSEEKRCSDYRGSLFLVQGTIYDAVCGKLLGETAALKLLSMEGVQVSSCSLHEEITRRIHKSNQNLLINAMIHKDHLCCDEAEHNKLEQQQRLLDEGIRLCERLEFGQAQKPLMTFVKDNQENALGWLWLSRAMTDPKKIKAALSKAYKISPEHAEIIEDAKKIRLLNDFDPELKVNRCPFCYAPVDQQIVCNFCKASILGESQSLEKFNIYGVERRLVQQAAKRFERILAAEVNPKMLFYAGAAYLNLNDLDKALTYFDLLMPIIQVDTRYQKVSEQVGQILEYIASNQKPEEQRVEAKEDKQLITNQANRRTVLVVEDSPTTRKVVKMTLQSGGFRVIEAVDGVEALSKLNDDRPDLVLLDIMLPKIDGYKVLSILKKNGDTKDIPVVMLTSKNRIIDKVKGHLSSANAYLTKPFKPAELINIVHGILDKNAPDHSHQERTTAMQTE